MTDHLVFTSCRCSVESDSEGMQIYSYSAGMPEQIKTELQRMGSYTVSGTTLKSSLSDKSEADGYPVAFRYVPKSETNILMTSSRYLGVDWSGTRFGGNYISHGIKTDHLPVYPIECFGESFFLNNVEYFDVSSDVRPHYLPPLDIVVSKNRKISFKSIREFILNGRIQETKMLISSIIDMKSKILFSDIQENVPKWIAVATLLLPLNMSKRVAFSTFGNLPEDISPSLVSVYGKSDSFVIISGAKEVDPFMDAYVDWIIADPERRDAFFEFIESKVVVADLETLKIELARYLLEAGDSDTINTLGLMDVCSRMVMSSRYDIGSLAIHTYLSYLVSCGLYDQFMKEYRMLSPCVRNKCDIDDLTKIYDQRSIVALKSVTSYEQIKVNQDHYMSIISRNIDSELIDKLDSAAVAFLVYEYWKACNDERSRKLLSTIPDNISVREIKKAIKEVDTAIENLWKGIEQGQAVDMLTERLHQRQVEKEELETQLAIENNKKICLSEAQILAFLDYVCEMPLDDFNKRRAIINIFVHSIYLYDDHFTLIINASKKPLSIENIPLDDIEEAFEGENTETEGCSSMMTPAPP